MSQIYDEMTSVPRSANNNKFLAAILIDSDLNPHE
ncbi:predicted protein [Botrytis cinerea T4]|uniref:Uncharacterized protein n=1 Tax=Botryotinia fuckeliana (strain T4) TaxID=999810 RepID=G2XN49_BOTF4|nr:predicted protein [Botrytis cinerea T4]